MAKRKPLTDPIIRQKKPGDRRLEVHDGGSKGLYLHIQPSGAKSFVMLITRPNGKPGKLWLGPFELSHDPKPRPIDEKTKLPRDPEIGDHLSLADVRWLAEDIRKQRRADKDVIGDRKIEKQSRKDKAEQPDTKFAAVARQFIDEHARPNTRRWRETAHALGLDYKDKAEPTRMKDGLAERWQDREIITISSDEVHRLVDEAKRRGIPGLPCRTKGFSNSRGRTMARVLSKLFGWALQHRKISASPSVGVFVPPAPASRERVLTEDEIIRFWRATDKIAEPFGAMLKLLLLTGARLREVAGMRRSELSAEGAIWTIPASRTKNKKEFVLPLPPLARDIIAGVKQVERSDFVFTTTGRTAVSGFSKTKKRLDELMSENASENNVSILDTLTAWRLHDLRRTAATIMNDSPPNGLGIAPHIVEACLNHISGSRVGVAGVYNRAEYLPEKLAAFQRWAAWIGGLVTDQPSATVTPIGKKRQ